MRCAPSGLRLICPTGGRSLTHRQARCASRYRDRAEMTKLLPARREKILLWNQADLPCPVPFRKIFLFYRIKIRPIFSPSRPKQRGVSRTSKTRGGLRWTRGAQLTRALSCVRQRRVVLAWRRICQAGGGNSPATESIKPVLRGEHVISRKAIACGDAG